MQGRLLHRWKLHGWVRMHAVLLPNGNLLYGILTPGGPLPDLPFTGGAVIEADWDGRIVWKYEDPDLHSHDFCRMKNGNTLVTKFVPVPKEIASRVKGGYLGAEIKGGIMYGDAIQEITPDRKVAWEWVSYEHLAPEIDVLGPICMPTFWPLFNSLVELPDGDIMVCSPQVSNIYIIERATGQIKWRWGQGLISFPHNPTLLDTGNILVFDNGRHVRANRMFPPDFSRVIEINPNTEKIEWEYRANNPVDFYSTYLSGCQRLPNGNTLICEGAMGRVFEVTPSGELAWEYIIPFTGSYPEPNPAQNTNVVFRAHRYGPDYAGLQKNRATPEKLDWWNHLYGPEGFSPLIKPTGGDMNEASNEVEKTQSGMETLQQDH
ncbi:MAG: arylsulfotransferase family protein [Desulfatiglandales bacterium]|nr:arylsulfotransferase family protein [Desulfatiglandales bacterium]